MLRSIVILSVFLAPLPLAAQRDSRGSEDVWRALREKYDANEDGRIDAKEYPRGEEKFRRFDRNGDGVLNILDFVCFQEAFQAGCP